MSQQNFQTERQNEISKRNFQTKFLTVISKRNIQTNIQTKFPSSFQTEQKLLVQNRAANSYPPAYTGCHGLRPQVLSSYTLDLVVPNHTVCCVLLWLTSRAVGGGTRNMCSGIVRQDYTGTHIHAFGWTSPQRLFIFRQLRRGRCPRFNMTRQLLQCSSLWNYFHPWQFA